MNEIGRTIRLMITGPLSAFGMNCAIPIPIDVNAAVPSSSVSTRPGSAAVRRSTPQTRIPATIVTIAIVAVTSEVEPIRAAV
jgi:hypothetical protein